MKSKSTVVLQFISQDGSPLGWQHPHTTTVNLPELWECVTIKSWFMKLDALQFLQNTPEVSSSQLSLTYIRQKCSNYTSVVSKTSPSSDSFIQSVILKVSTCGNTYHKNVWSQCTLPKRIKTTTVSKTFSKTPSREELFERKCSASQYAFHFISNLTH